MLQLKIKEVLLDCCEVFVNKRLKTVADVISSNQKALASETKSSAGDKHETGRAMLQLEMEKAGQQLEGIRQMKTILAKVNTSKVSEKAHLGSIIITNKRSYFLCISAGQFVVENRIYFAVSVASPIGKLLLGTSENKVFSFSGVSYKVQEIM
jgi:hypothetical protein